MASLKLYLLGVPRIELDEQLVTIQRRKALALLFYLAINGKSQSRDTLATLLWPDNNQKQARLALNRHLFELREQLGGDWLESDHQTIGLRAAADLWLDVDLFQRHLATCASAIPTCRAPLTQAVSLYRADFLTGFTLSDCPEFDEWQFFQSEGLRQQFAAALERLIEIQQDQDDYEAAIPLARRWVALDPLHEPAQRYLMQLYAQTGQQAAALRQYQLCRQTLADELGAAPDAQTTMLYERIRSGALSSSASKQEHKEGREKEQAEGLSVVPQPSGTVTFLFTDIEGSTALWERHPQVMREALARHDALLLAAITAHSGARVKGTGDGIHAAFARAPDALRAALAAQRALHGQDWGATPIKVRMALHSAAVEERDGDYFGRPLNRAARLLSVGHGGQILLSLTTHELVRDQLPAGVTLRHLGKHRLKDLNRPELIFQVNALNLPVDFPPLATVTPSLSNLPAQPTPFLGRAQELAALEALLAQPGRRLVTILGPGGMGKTRLALETGQRLRDQFRDGVWFLALDAVDADSFSPALNPLLVGLAKTLGLTLHGGSPPEAQVLAYLQERQLLLIFDNLEHLVDSSEVISRLLSGTQGIKALVTSRKRLNLQEEWLFSLSGLALALEPGGPAQPQAGISEAVQLFQQVAQRVQPTFDLNASFNAVEQICRLVEGMPLGIELAASWARHLSPAAIVQEVENDIDFLATNVRNLPARHRSLRAVFDHSWRLLSALEQAVLPQLAVFRGGFRRTEAQAIASASLYTLAALVDKSLLSASASGRYGLHERLRQYLLEKLRQNVEVYQTTRDRHSQVYLSLLHIDPADLTKKAVLDLITADIDNIRSAWNWALDQAQWSAIRRSRTGLGWFYFHKGWLLASNDLFAQAVSTLKQRLTGSQTSPEPATIAEMQCLLAALQCYHCDIQSRLGLQSPATNAIVQESLAILRAADPPAPRELADCLLTAGQPLARRITVDHTAERQYLQESLALYQQLGDSWGQCEPLAALSFVAVRQGRLAEAEEYARQLFLLAETTGNLFHLGIVSYLQGRITQARGQYAQAERKYEDGYQRMLAISSQSAAMVLVCNGLANIARLRGDYDQAIAYLQQAEFLTHKMGLGHPADARRHETLLFSGYLAEDRGDTLTAQQQFQEVLRQDQAQSHLSAAALIGLGQVALQMREPQTAGRHFATALHLIPKLQTAPQALETLAGVARWQAEAGQLEPALALVGLVLSHPSSTQETKDRVAGLEAELKTGLSPEQAQAVLVRGQTSELWASVAEVRARLAVEIGFGPAA